MSNKSILQSNNDSLSANNLDLQSLIDQANALPDAGGIELPELSNPANADEVFFSKQLIDGDGEVVTGTFTIDNELDAQDDLITQLQAAVDSLPEAGGGESSFPYTVTVNGMGNYSIFYNKENVEVIIVGSAASGYGNVTVLGGTLINNGLMNNDICCYHITSITDNVTVTIVHSTMPQ